MMRTIQEFEKQEHSDTEITLGMKSLLGIFFGLVLICGVFFGFGYSLGRGGSSSPASLSRSAQGSATEAASAKPPAEQDLTTVSSEQSPASTGARREVQPAPVAEAGDAVHLPVTADDDTPPAVTHKPAAGKVKPVVEDSATAASPAPVVASAPAPAGATASAGSTMVQIAAVSHQQDADVLIAALKKRGYTVIVRNEPKDNLLHVQVGPFATRDEARAMRVKLMGDGYNAILK
jgi:DedD protein